MPNRIASLQIQTLALIIFDLAYIILPQADPTDSFLEQHQLVTQQNITVFKHNFLNCMPVRIKYCFRWILVFPIQWTVLDLKNFTTQYYVNL